MSFCYKSVELSQLFLCEANNNQFNLCRLTEYENYNINSKDMLTP